MNPANKVTALRLVLGLLSVLLLVLVGKTAALVALLFFVVSVSLDKVDGHLARTRGCETTLGRSFDNATDNCVLWVHFFALIELQVFGVWLVAAAIVREVFLQGLWDYADMSGVAIRKLVLGHSRYLCQVTAIACGIVMLWLEGEGATDFSFTAHYLSVSFMALSLIIGYSTCVATYYLNREAIARAI